MRTWLKLAAGLLLCLMMDMAGAAAQSGVTILSAPEAVDLYLTSENIGVSGSVCYQLDEGVTVRRYSITQYEDIAEPDMNITDEGGGRYRVDFQIGYVQLAMENYNLPEEMPCTFSIETDKGMQNVEFLLRLHEEWWDPDRLEYGCERDAATVGDEIRLAKPLLDGEQLPDTWVNDYEYSEETLQLAEETDTELVFRAIRSGRAMVSYTMREINSNRSNGVVICNFPVFEQGTDRILLGQGDNALHRMCLSEGEYSAGYFLDWEGEGWGRFDEEQLTASAYLRDPGMASVAIEAGGHSNSSTKGQLHIDYSLSDFQKAGSTELVVNVEYQGVKHQKVIPILIIDDSGEPDIRFDFPREWYYGDVIEFTASGADKDLYRWHIDCPAFELGTHKVSKHTGVYSVKARLTGEKEIDLGTVTVMERGGTAPENSLYFYGGLHMETNSAYCSTIGDAVTHSTYVNGNCPSGADDHQPSFEYSIVSQTAGCPYAIELLEPEIMAADEYPGDIDDEIVIRLTPKAIPLTAGSYPFVLEAKMSCCGQTATLRRTIPILIVDPPENPLDHICLPPSTLRVGDLWSRYEDRNTPLHRYAHVVFSFEGRNTREWGPDIYQMLEAGSAAWTYEARYLNGKVPLCSGSVEILEEDDEAVVWHDIVSALAESGAYSGGGVTATLTGGKAVVSGGTIRDVEITDWLPKAITTVELDNTTVTGYEMIVKAAGGREIAVTLGENLETQLSEYVSVTAASGGKVTFTNHAGLEKLECAVRGGEMTAANDADIAVRWIASTSGQSTLALSNAGTTGTILAYAYDGAQAQLTSSGTAGVVIAEADGGSRMTVVNNGTAAGLAAAAYDSGAVTVTNNGTITNEAGRDDNKRVYLEADKTGSITLSGTGSIRPGTACLDDLTGEVFSERPAETMEVHVTLGGAYAGVEAARSDAIAAFRSHIALNLTGIQAHEGMDQLVVVASYTDASGAAHKCLIRQTELYDEESGAVVAGGAAALAQMTPVSVPTLILPDGAAAGAVFLKYKAVETDEENTAIFDVHLVDQNGNTIAVPLGSILCLPYPQGITGEMADQYSFTVTHYADNGTEEFTSEDGTVTCERAGLCVRVSSLSPFEIRWAEKPAPAPTATPTPAPTPVVPPEDVLPKTGDGSQPALYALLLAASMIGLAALRRRGSAR